MTLGETLLMAVLLMIGGCASRPSVRPIGEPELPPASEPIPVTLNANGHFTAEGMRISFLRECAETTAKDGYDSFELFHYVLMQPGPRHYEAHGEIVEARDRIEHQGKNVFDARKVLADPGFSK
jgi:hypothetical protein